MKDYVTFEHIRKDKGGGGLLTAVHRNLASVCVSSNEDTEILVVEAKTGNSKTRFINAYGPQENCDDDIKETFYNNLDTEVKKSKLSGSRCVCIEMDANAKLGPKFISKDPHPQSKNGKLLEKFINDNDLVVVNGSQLWVVVNGSQLCEGSITRKRVTIVKKEESILDYFIVCKEMLKLILKMKIDEERKHCLTKFSTTKGRKSTKESDHNLLYLKILVSWNSVFNERSTRVESFNFSDEEAFAQYQEITNSKIWTT